MTAPAGTRRDRSPRGRVAPYDRVELWLAEHVGDELERIAERAFRVPCPCHPHTGPQLLVYAASDGRAVLACDQSCDIPAIANGYGLHRSDVIEPDEEAVAAGAVAPSSGEPLEPRFRLISDLELEQLPPIEFLVEGVLPRAGLAAIYGPPAAGKSFLALDMACAIATGTTWLENRTKQGRVVYVASEGSAGLKQRLAAWKAQQGLTGVSIPISFLTQPVNLLGSVDVAALLLAIAKLPERPALIIIDTLHRSMPGGDENSAKDVGLVIEHAERLRRETGASVLLVHHTAKGSDLERGSSSLRGAVDALLYAKHDAAAGRILSCEKAKDWAPFPEIAFELLVVGQSCVVAVPETAESYRVEALTPQMRKALTILSRDFATHGATVTEWLKATELPESSFYRARSDLVHGGYVAEPPKARGGRYRATESGRHAVTLNSHEALNSLPRGQQPLTPILSEARSAESDGRKAQE